MSVPPAPRRAAAPGRATSPLQSQVVDHALATCSCVVSVCEAQRQLYQPTNGQVVFVGVPQPAPAWRAGAPPRSSPRQLTLLCLGIVCPRKNQLMAAEVFKEWAGSRKDVRLLIVGARYIRKYELEYVEKVKAVVGNDTRIEVHDVTSDVDAFYRQSDLLLFCSLNEVTPMVIAESMMRSIPVLTTNIAGIPGATGVLVVRVNSIEPTAHHVDLSRKHPSTWHITSSLTRPRCTSRVLTHPSTWQRCSHTACTATSSHPRRARSSRLSTRLARRTRSRTSGACRRESTQHARVRWRTLRMYLRALKLRLNTADGRCGEEARDGNVHKRGDGEQVPRTRHAGAAESRDRTRSHLLNRLSE